MLFAFENIAVPISFSNDKKIESGIKSYKNRNEKIERLEKLALDAYKNNNYDLSIKSYTRLLSFTNSNKKRFRYYMMLGDIYCCKNNCFFGMDMYHKAWHIYKKNEEVNIKIANLYVKNNMCESAEKIFNAVLKKHKKSVYAKKGLGNIFYLQNDYKKAILYYEQIKITNFDEDIILNLSECYHSLSDIGKSIEILDKYNRDNATDKILFYLGKLYVENREYIKAEEVFLKLYAKDKYDLKVCLYLASIYYFLDEISLSKSMLENIYKVYPYSTVDILQAQVAYKLCNMYDAKKYSKRAQRRAKTTFLRDLAKKKKIFFKVNNL